MIDPSSMNFASLKELNKSLASDVVNLLNEKYKEDFVVHLIGDRLASAKANELTAYCTPKMNPKIVFKVLINSKRELVSDDYYNKILCMKACEFLDKYLATIRDLYISSGAVSHLFGDVPVNMDFSDVISNQKGLLITFDIFSCECSDCGAFYDGIVAAFNDLYKMDPSVSLGLTFWNLNREMYEACRRELLVAPRISKTVLGKMNPIGIETISLLGGKANISKEMFADSILGLHDEKGV